MSKIDWSKPLELSDGTPLVLKANVLRGNPDADGDYYLVRADGKPLTLEQCDLDTSVFIAGRTGKHWLQRSSMTVRNRRTSTARREFKVGDRVNIVGHSGAVYPSTVQALSSSVVMVRADGDTLLLSFFRETGEATGPVKLLRLGMTPPAPVRKVHYQTFGHSGVGGVRGETVGAVAGLIRAGDSHSGYGVLKFTEEDGKIVDIEVVYVRK